MTLDDFREKVTVRLSGMYDPSEVKNLCFLAIQHVMGMNRVEVSLSRKLKISPNQSQELHEVLRRLEKSEPIQYIVGFTEFYGLSLQVNPATLIPRPETEELVAWIVDSHTLNGATPLHILDIGTGSGCIAIALAKNCTRAKVEAVDISQNALATAYQNAKAHQVVIDFYHQDILETESLDSTYDIIVSNPPYVRDSEKMEIRDNVLQHEPANALFVSDTDPLIFYKKIGSLAVKSLTPNGTLYLEINEYLGQEMIALLKSIGFAKIFLKKDMFGKDRMICAMRY